MPHSTAIVKWYDKVDAMVHTKALALVHQHLQQQATVSAYQEYFVLLTLMTLAVIPLVCFLRKQQAECSYAAA
jgi:hypothetical protein